MLPASIVIARAVAAAVQPVWRRGLPPESLIVSAPLSRVMAPVPPNLPDASAIADLQRAIENGNRADKRAAVGAHDHGSAGCRICKLSTAIPVTVLGKVLAPLRFDRAAPTKVHGNCATLKPPVRIQRAAGVRRQWPRLRLKVTRPEAVLVLAYAFQGSAMEKPVPAIVMDWQT